MRLLVLGGSWFLGARIVVDALAGGWDVTTFRRGQTGADVAGVQAIRGDRATAGDLARLAEAGPWDAVVDTSGYVPANVGRVARALEPVANRYVLLSTVSVYQNWPGQPVSEDSELRDCAPDVDSVDGSPGDPGPARYGAFKAGAERAVVNAFGAERAVLLRPGVITGPREYVGRLPWWLHRVERGGRVLAPGSPLATIQPIDVRDVSAFTMRALAGLRGAYNLTGADATFAAFLNACRHTTGSDASFEWITDQLWLAEHVSPWVEVPLWHTAPGAWSVDSARALSAGLRLRSFSSVVADVWQWMHDGEPAIDHPRAGLIGLTAEKEKTVLAAWDAHNGASRDR